MKTLTTVILLVAALAINTTTYAAKKNDERATVLNEVNRVNNIEVRGNVLLYVSDGTADQVKVYNRYDKENALVQDQNGVLRVTSYKAEKLVVWITISDLRAISVYDNAEVRSFGKLSALDLDVKLYNSASAQLNIDACRASISLAGIAKANISGNITDAEIKYDKSASLNISDLASTNLNKSLNTERLLSIATL